MICVGFLSDMFTTVCALDLETAEKNYQKVLTRREIGLRKRSIAVRRSQLKLMYDRRKDGRGRKGG